MSQILKVSKGTGIRIITEGKDIVVQEVSQGEFTPISTGG